MVTGEHIRWPQAACRSSHDRLSQEGHISTSIFLRTAGLLILSNIFMTFAWYAVLYMRQPLKLDYLWAALCLVGAVYFMFRSPAGP